MIKILTEQEVNKKTISKYISQFGFVPSYLREDSIWLEYENHPSYVIAFNPTKKHINISTCIASSEMNATSVLKAIEYHIREEWPFISLFDNEDDCFFIGYSIGYGSGLILDQFIASLKRFDKIVTDMTDTISSLSARQPTHV